MCSYGFSPHFATLLLLISKTKDPLFICGGSYFQVATCWVFTSYYNHGEPDVDLSSGADPPLACHAFLSHEERVTSTKSIYIGGFHGPCSHALFSPS